MPEIRDGIQHLRAGDWEAAHRIAQDEGTPLGAWLHGIVHLIEGDVSNARYWYARAGRTCPPRDQVDAELNALESRVRMPAG